MIPQKLLQDYFDACQERRDAEKRAERLKAEIDTRLADGEKVADGNLVLVVKESSRQSLTWGAITEILGVEAAQDLRGRLPATPIKTVTVSPRKEDKAPARPADAGRPPRSLGPPSVSVDGEEPPY